ncbi:hypothetical protein GCM10023185_28940 [Hymenobacter saemangeumensis]|uniref:DUF3575 domain-containing protein n=1 Tax=Hymenobacter saemangeumensis TaxID=1084522 RepID=A0ABP8IKV2_9BACT
MQPHLTSIREQGEAEFKASLQPATLRTQASVTYSPARHMLVAVAGSWRPDLDVAGDSSMFRASTAEVGVGGYWPLNERWTLQGIGGFGWGNTARNVSSGGLIFSQTNDYYARYGTMFGQGGLMYSSHRRFKLGFGYRLTRVSFEELRGSYYELPNEAHFRHEPFISMRIELGQQPVRRWQLEASAALSVDTEANTARDYGYYSDPNRNGAALLGVGVVYLLRPKAGK